MHKILISINFNITNLKIYLYQIKLVFLKYIKFKYYFKKIIKIFFR
jgi:hypothetical protein